MDYCETYIMTIDLETLHLASGGHDNRDQGVCLLEAVAWFAGKDHTDHPPCVSPALGVYGRSLNDVLPDEARQALIPFIPAMPGTAGDGKEETRGLIALDWLIRTYLPAWCDLVPALAGDAAALRGLPRIGGMGAASAAGKIVLIVRDNAAAAGAAARAAAGAAAWAAARAAARDATWDAAGAAAGDAAGAAAGDAARDATWAAAWAATWAAAGAAAWAAAWDAAWDAAWAATGDAAGDAAGAAARDALAPTVTQLQQSAVALLPVLIAGEWPDGVQ